MMNELNDGILCTVCQTTPAAPRLFPCGHVICAKCLAETIKNSYDEDGDPISDPRSRCPTCRKGFAVPTTDLEQLPVQSPTEKEPPEIEKSSDKVSEPEVARNISFVNGSKSKIPTEVSKHKDTLPTVDSLVIDDIKTPPTDIFTTSISMDVNQVTPFQNGPKTQDIMDARLPLQSLVVAKATENGLTNGSGRNISEEEISLDDDASSNASTELNNLCSICKLTGKYVASSTYCITCGCLICTSCTKIHQEHSPDRNHVLVSLTNENLNTVLCRSHDQLIRFFCLTCCVPVCKACLTEHHTQHKMTDFATAYREDHTNKRLGWHIQNHLKELRMQKRALTKAHEVTEMNRRDTNMTIIKCIDSQIRYLQEERQELVDRSDQYHGLVKEQMNNVERQVDRATAIMQDLQLKVDTSLYPLPPHAHVVPAVFPTTIIQKKFTSVTLPAKDHRDFGINGCRYTQGAAPDAGSMSVGLPISTTEFTEVSASRSNRKSKVKVLWNKAVEVQDIHFLPNSKDLLFTDISKGYTMHKLNCDGKLAPLLVGLSGFSGRECTFGINKYTKYKIIAYKPEPKGNDMVLSVFNNEANSTDVNLVGATFPPGYNTLVSVTITLDDYIIAVLSDEPNKPRKTSICCFDMGGHLMWQRNTTTSTRAGDLSFPVFVTTDKLDRVIISDRDGSKVNIYTTDGSHLLSFPKLDDDDALSNVQPTGICIDSRGRILVSFFDLQVVSLFSANGAFVRHLVQTPGSPWGISLCDQDRYLVVALENHGLWLYDLIDID